MQDWQDLTAVPFGPDILVEDMGHGILRLSEMALLPAERSFFYLLAGREGICLIDGGWGLGRGLPERITGHPGLTAVATHSHFDHIGHLHQGATRLGHRLEAAIFADPAPLLTQATPYLTGRPVLRDGQPLPTETWAQKPCPLTAEIDEGARIELGGRCLTILHTPGHSPGSISVYDPVSQTLFCGDVLLPGHIYDDIPGADPATIVQTHHRMANVPFRRTLGGHGPALERDSALARMADYRRGLAP